MVQNLFLPWLQTYFLHFAFVAALLGTVAWPFFLLRRRLRHMLAQDNLWRELEQTIGDLLPEACHYYPQPTRQVLTAVLAKPQGAARAGAVEPALEYLGAALDSPLSLMRSLSYLAVLVGLLGTVTLLALALQSVDAIGQFKIEQLKNIYPLNAVAIGLAVFMYLSFVWYRHRADQFLLQVARVLSRLRVEELGAADPVLLATLEKVGEKFQDWAREIQEEHLRQSQRLVQEVRDVAKGLRHLVAGALSSRQEEDRALTPLLRSQDAKLEQLQQRLYQNYLLLTKAVGRPDDLPETEPDFSDQPWPDIEPNEGRGRRQTGFWSRWFK